MAASYLEALNPEQRRAVEHGVTVDGHVGAPLLVIAGAGSGKTNTLAHRVAHLIVSGADPRRILLMTFSRRAASEMSKRVERIARKLPIWRRSIQSNVERSSTASPLTVMSVLPSWSLPAPDPVRRTRLRTASPI